MNKLLAGFSRLDVTPPLGIPIVGYYKPRFAEGVLDAQRRCYIKTAETSQ